uniref:Uncharacterized protein n=1 Tax=Peronospora matthiolae TaxID=2874970 RepID=A0AAV1UMT0_9STRA
MTKPKPSSDTLEECVEEGMVDYETVASSVYDHLQLRNRRVTPRASRQIHSWNARRYLHPLHSVQSSTLCRVCRTTLSVKIKHNNFQSADDRSLQAQCVATVYAHSGYRFTQPTVDERFRQTAE